MSSHFSLPLKGAALRQAASQDIAAKGGIAYDDLRRVEAAHAHAITALPAFLEGDQRGPARHPAMHPVRRVRLDAADGLPQVLD